MDSKYEGFRDLYNSFARELYWVALALCGDECLSEDIVHEVFVQVWERYDQLRSEVKDLHPFLITMTRNKTVDYLRHVQVHYRNEKAVAYEWQFNNDLEEEDMSDLITRAKALLDKLPPKCRETFLLAILNDMSYQEIATYQNVSINTVKTQMKIARRRLKDEMPSLVIGLLLLRSFCF